MNIKATFSYCLTVVLMLISIWTQSWMLALIVLPCTLLLWHKPARGRFNNGINKLSSKKKQWVSWIISALSAIIILFFINNYLFGVYKLQSSSMEPTYSAGSLFLMNKLTIGAGKSIDDVNKYHRIRAWKKPHYGDVIMFYFPEADTVFVNNSKENYHFKKRESRISGKPYTLAHNKVEFKPVHQRPRFIKRIVALPGDTMEIKNGQYLINNKSQEYNSTFIHQYILSKETPSRIRRTILKTSYSNYSEDNQQIIEIQERKISEKWSTYLQRKEMPLNMPDPYIFPFSTSLLWNASFWGPAIVPQKGQTISINEHNISLYWRIIKTYEGNDLEIKKRTLYLNGEPCGSYTFKMDYYWVAGDNSPHSFDSRYWGFVPENHIIGILNHLPFSK